MTNYSTYKPIIEAAIEASEAILKIYNTEFQAILKEDGSPVTKADIVSSNIIKSYLDKTGLPTLGEEQVKPSFEERSQWNKYWTVDPLDGTKMFIQRNDEFAVNIALIEMNKPIFGLIADPVNRKIVIGGVNLSVFIFSFDDYLNQTKWQKIISKKSIRNPLSVICSRSYKHGAGFKYVKSLEDFFGEIHFIKKGSALKFFDLLTGNADIYTRFAPTMEWDIAAGHALLNELGGEIVTVDTNESLIYNKPSLYNPHFIAKTNAFLKAQ